MWCCDEGLQLKVSVIHYIPFRQSIPPFPHVLPENGNSYITNFHDWEKLRKNPGNVFNGLFSIQLYIETRVEVWENEKLKCRITRRKRGNSLLYRSVNFPYRSRWRVCAMAYNVNSFLCFPYSYRNTAVSRHTRKKVHIHIVTDLQLSYNRSVSIKPIFKTHWISEDDTN